jgi:hypothetical protein
MTNPGTPRAGRSSFRRFIAAAALLTLVGTATVAQDAAGPTLNPDRPDRYVVRPGDTLWGISSLFLRDPWYWPEIWTVNPQVANPHLIYPGDVLNLVYVDGRPQLQMERGGGGSVARASGTDRLSPRIREQQLGDAITTIPYAVIAPFLTRGTVLERNEISKLPYVVAMREELLVGAAGNDLYVRGDVAGEDSTYSVVHVGEKLIDPDNGDVVAYEATYVGEGVVRRTGDPSTLHLNNTAREALRGDRLLAVEQPFPLQFQPRPPGKAVDGRIIHVVDGVYTFGQYQVVVLNRGSRHGLEAGHVLTVLRAGERVTDIVQPGLFGDKVRLPDEEAGTVMVFRTYDRISYALVMRSSAQLREFDKVKNPS